MMLKGSQAQLHRRYTTKGVPQIHQSSFRNGINNNFIHVFLEAPADNGILELSNCGEGYKFSVGSLLPARLIVQLHMFLPCPLLESGASSNFIINYGSFCFSLPLLAAGGDVRN
jgi:hypothetical protein